MSQKKTKEELSGANRELQKVKTTREQIVAEYLTGNYTYRELGLKYDIPFRSICDWVLEYQGRKPTWREKMKRKRENGFLAKWFLKHKESWVSAFLPLEFFIKYKNDYKWI